MNASARGLREATQFLLLTILTSAVGGLLTTGAVLGRVKLHVALGAGTVLALLFVVPPAELFALVGILAASLNAVPLSGGSFTAIAPTVAIAMLAGALVITVPTFRQKPNVMAISCALAFGALLLRVWMSDAGALRSLWLVSLLPVLLTTTLVAVGSVRRDTAVLAVNSLFIIVCVLTVVFVLRHPELLRAWGSIALNKEMPLLGHLNVAAGVLVGTLPTAFVTARKGLRSGVAVLAATCLFLTGSRTGWAVGLVELGLLVRGSVTLAGRKWAQIGFPALVGVLVLLAAAGAASIGPLRLVQSRVSEASESSYSGRPAIWADEWRVARSHLLFGEGPQGVSVDLRRTSTHSESLSPDSPTGARIHAHDVFLTLLGVAGLPLTLAFGALLVAAARRGLFAANPFGQGVAALVGFGLLEDLFSFSALATTTMLLAVSAFVFSDARRQPPAAAN